MSYDIIGDVHGHADCLVALLERMGYRHRNGAWRHVDRTAIFVGDLIDRGPQQRRTLEIVRDMVKEGTARATMGNHEFNAIAWATEDPAKPGDFLRSHDGHHAKQHEAFLTQLGKDEREEWVQWFWQLPLWIEEPRLQVVHACWSPKHVEFLRSRLKDGVCLTPEILELGCRKDERRDGEITVYQAIETILKGVEVRLPGGRSFKDKGGHERFDIRTRWWKPGHLTFEEAHIGPPPDTKVPEGRIPESALVPAPDRPTFVGHYWLPGDEAVKPQTDRVACLDYSVANNGPLVAYRFDGETTLAADRFDSVPPRSTGAE